MAISYMSRRKDCLSLKVNKLDQDLFLAMKEGDRAGLRQAVVNGANIDAINSAGLTCVGEAAEAGDLDVIQLLLKEGSDVNKVDFYGQTALQYAAEQGHTAVAQRLVNHGADVNYMDEGGLSVLHIAVIKGALGVVRVLIDSKASVNIKDVHGLTILQCAVSGGDMDMVQLLLTAGSHVNAVGAHGRSALFSAGEAGRLDMVKALVTSGAKINLQDDYGMTPLSFVCHQSITDVALYLLDAGAKVKLLDRAKNQALHHAVRAQDTAVVEALLLKGSCPTDMLNSHFEAPIHLAVRMRNLNIIKLLVKHGCDVNICEPYGSVTALHVAVNVMNCAVEFEKILCILIEGGADINSLAFTSLESPLYRAVALDKTQIAKTLIQYGADVNIPCPFDVTVLHKACERKNIQIIHTVLHAGIDWRNETWLRTGIHQSGINTELLHGYDASVPRILVHLPDYLQLLQSFQQNPQSLHQLCRLNIRQMLQRKLHLKLQHLPVPARLRQYLLLREL